MTAVSTKAAMPIDHKRIPIFPINAKVITGSNTDVFAQPVALFVGGAGDIVVTPFGADSSGTDMTFTVTAAMVSAGPWSLPFMIRALKATGTTATAIFGVW